MAMQVSKRDLKFLGFSDEQLRKAAQRTANVYARIANQRLRCNIPIPVPMEFELEYKSLKNAKCGGVAHSSMMIELNMTMLRDNVEEFLNSVIPHEVAHLVQFQKFDLAGTHTDGHGVHWLTAMEFFGKYDAPKYHKMDTTKAVQEFLANKKQQSAKTKLTKKLLKNLF